VEQAQCSLMRRRDRRANFDPCGADQGQKVGQT
jgi:hypothetical protein